MAIVTSNEVTIVVESPPTPPTPAISCSLSVDKTTCRVGDTVTFTVTITGLEGSYSVYIMDRNGNIIAGGTRYLYKSGTTLAFTWTPTTAGTYYLHAEVWYIGV
ncbi:MAG: hypothetical protein QXR05_10955 [Candidatus Methanomethylicia archaeon]